LEEDMLLKISKVPWMGATVVAVLLAGLLGGVAVAGPDATVFHGCRTRGGVIIKVTFGDETERLCKPWQTEIVWTSSVSIVGPVGPAGPQGEVGPQGPMGPAAEVADGSAEIEVESDVEADGYACWEGNPDPDPRCP
jgi:hypothetical protein